MVKKGRTYEQSAAGIDMLVTLVRLVDQVKLSLGTGKDLTQAQLSLKLNVP